MQSLSLHGCTPTPLGAYLKALGVFRVLSQQNPNADLRSGWHGNVFYIKSHLTREAVVEFFINDYRPTPILSPWNGDGGFFPDSRKAGQAALASIEHSTAPRFEPYRKAVIATKIAIKRCRLEACPEKGTEKDNLLLAIRNQLSDDALVWIDAAAVLTENGSKFPPLLGTGGNDGSMDFSKNNMQRFAEVFDLGTGKPTERCFAWLENSLWGTNAAVMVRGACGQFSPAAGGGANASTGFDAQSATNPWDYILNLEGALLFAAATIKRLEGTEPGQLVYPFCVQSTGSGYGSSASADETNARCEIWMPLWQNEVSLAELQTLLAEGRAWVGRRPAKNGVDFARAIASLGVDRGIGEFQRYGFHVRNGLAYFATPLQRLRVRRDHVTADLLSDCDNWIQRFLSKAKAANAPGSVGRAGRRLEAAILAQCAAAQTNHPPTAQELLASLGDCERALATSSKWTAENYLKPIPPLSSKWIEAAATGDSEYRLAASLASLGLWVNKQSFPIRRHLEPVKIGHGSAGWADWDTETADVVSSDGSATSLLVAIMRRRLLLAQKLGADSWPEYAQLTAWPSDIAAFIEGSFDDDRFIRLLWALCLVGFRADNKTPSLPRPNSDTPPAFFGQLKLCFAARLPGDRKVPVTPPIFHLSASGDGARASEHALRRLHASSIPVTHVHIGLSGQAAERTAAALLFPLWDSQLKAACEPVARQLFS